MTTDAPAPADDPFPANYKALIIAHKSDIFIDPDSVRDAAASRHRSGTLVQPLQRLMKLLIY